MAEAKSSELAMPQPRCASEVRTDSGGGRWTHHNLVDGVKVGDEERFPEATVLAAKLFGQVDVQAVIDDDDLGLGRMIGMTTNEDVARVDI